MKQHRGLDIGTMNLVGSKLNTNNELSISIFRNMFIEIDKDNLGTLDLKSLNHAIIDNKIYILSKDAFNFANIFNKAVNRPMEKGLISSKEIDSADILAAMIKELIGQAETKDAKCVYSVPANPIDSDYNIIYHQNVFGRILSQLGYEPIPLNEALAVIYAECESTDFSGVAISFGAGMSNVAVAYKSVPVLSFSVSRGGDWIDQNVALSTSSVANRVTLAKENGKFSLTNLDLTNVNKKDRKVYEALIYYYRNLITYVMKNIVVQLNKLTVDLPEDMPLIISGGTSLANGFIDLAKEVLKDQEFPFNLSEIKYATNQLTAVAEGCLIKALK